MSYLLTFFLASIVGWFAHAYRVEIADFIKAQWAKVNTHD